MDRNARKRRHNNDFAVRNMSGDSASGNVQEKRQRREDKEELERLRRENERQRREDKEKLKSDPVLEMKKIQEFVQWFPDQQKETESSVRELKNIAAYIRNDKDALVGGIPATSFIRTGAWFGAAGVAAGAALAPFTFGASLAVTAAVSVAAGGAFAAGKGASALKDYNKKLEEIRENARRRMTELGRSAATAIAAVLTLKRLSRSPDTAADPDHENVFEMLETDSGLRDLTERMEELLGASGTDTADSQIDKISETIFPYDLVGFLSLFSTILSFNIKNQKSDKARKIHDCAVKLEKNLQAGREIHTAMKTLCN